MFYRNHYAVVTTRVSYFAAREACEDVINPLFIHLLIHMMYVDVCETVCRQDPQ